MKKCPQCNREYNDETLNFCLDDGIELLYGPATDEPATAVIPEVRSHPVPEAKTRKFTGDEPSAPGNRDSRSTSLSSTHRNSVIAGIIGGLLLIALGVGAYIYYGRGTSRQIKSIAVMPFVNESGNPDVEYLSEGMTESLINSLTRLPGLIVKPRSSTFRYKGRESDTKVIGGELEVSAVLNGRLVQRGDDVTLFLTLVDTSSESQIWGKQYSRKLASLTTLQTEIVQDVSESLRQSVDEAIARTSYSANPEAYRLYLQGRYHWNKRSRRDLELAIDYFKQSTARDPHFAPAFAGLADSLSFIGGYTGTAAHESIADARAAAQTALSIDPGSAEAHTALGIIFFYYDHNFAEAEREFRRAIELDSKSGPAHHMLGLLLMATVRHEDGLSQYRLALAIEPVSLPINRGYALALTYARRYDESIVQFKKTIELDPSFALAYYGLAHTLSLQQRHAESVETYTRGIEIAGGGDSARNLRQAFAQGGWNNFVRAILDRRTLPGNTPTPPFVRALYFVQLGDTEEAFAELNRAFDDRDSFITLLKVHPGLDPLHRDPRFKELVKKIGLPE